MLFGSEYKYCFGQSINVVLSKNVIKANLISHTILKKTKFFKREIIQIY